MRPSADQTDGLGLYEEIVYSTLRFNLTRLSAPITCLSFPCGNKVGQKTEKFKSQTFLLVKKKREKAENSPRD